MLAIIPLDTPNARPMIIARDGEFDRREDIRTINWSWADPDNLLIWLASRQDFQGQPVDVVRVVGFNRQTRSLTPLGWDGAFLSAGRVIWTSRSGPPRILLERYAMERGERTFNPEVVEVDVTTGRHRVVQPPQRLVSGWSADGEGNIRLGTSFDRTTGRVTALYRSGGTGAFRTIIRQRTERYAEPPLPQIFLPGDRALALSRHSGFNALYELDLETMEFGRMVHSVEGYDLEGVLTNPNGDALDGVVELRHRPVRHWFDTRLREIQSVLDEAFGAGNATITSADRARENIVVRVAAPSQPGGFYLYRTQTGDVRHIGWVNTEIRDTSLNPVSTIRYRASDGQTIEAVLTLPRLREARNLPLIVLPHGGPWARDYETWDIWAQPLAEMGYAVIQPNFRGSSGYGQEWEAASDGNWGMRMQDDLNDAVNHLAAEGIADPGRVCMFGWSYGGYAASRAAQRDGDRYRCTISGAGVHDLPDMVAYDRNYLGRYGSQYIGSAATRLSDISPARNAGQFSAPILIVHGARDQRVPVAQSRGLVRRLRAAGKVEGRDFVYIEQPRNTHNLPLEADRLQLLEEARRFLMQHNPPD
ncbi:MAG: S9 family peptidase [Sphingomonas sp.]|nr:S9 family peptidase [Sphingomonas sp.]